MSARFTISPDVDSNGWRLITLHDGKRLTGRGEVCLYVAPADRRSRDVELVATVVLRLSDSLVDDAGHTVYRDAVTADDEVQRMSTVVRHPVRVNGLPYRATLYSEHAVGAVRLATVDKWGGPAHWRATSSSVERLDGGNVTDVARRLIWALADEVAREMATPVAVADATVRYYDGEVTRARSAVADAASHLDTAETLAAVALAQAADVVMGAL